MTTHLNKTDFIAKMQNEIAKAEIAVDFYNNQLKAVVNNFEGKVINKRFDNAVKALIDVAENRMFFKSENSYNAGERNYSLMVYTDKIGYTSVDLYLTIEIDPQTQRIIGIKGDGSIKYFIEGIEGRKIAISNYDTYIEQLKTVEDAIAKLSEIPCYLRQNVRLNSAYLPQ